MAELIKNPLTAVAFITAADILGIIGIVIYTLRKYGKGKRLKKLIITVVCLAAADVVICRAGASTLSELEAVGRASVLIPYPTAAENHQYHNAMVLGKAGAAMVIEQKDLTLERLKNAVAHLYEEPEKRMLMGQRAGALALTDVDERIWAVLEPLLARKKA